MCSLFMCMITMDFCFSFVIITRRLAFRKIMCRESVLLFSILKHITSISSLFGFLSLYWGIFREALYKQQKCLIQLIMINHQRVKKFCFSQKSYPSLFFNYPTNLSPFFLYTFTLASVRLSSYPKTSICLLFPLTLKKACTGEIHSDESLWPLNLLILRACNAVIMCD